jgi:hypothetical protein
MAEKRRQTGKNAKTAHHVLTACVLASGCVRGRPHERRAEEYCGWGGAKVNVKRKRVVFYGAFPPEADAPLAQAHGLDNFSCLCSEELKLLKTLD